jgi:hypothetical protein
MILDITPEICRDKVRASFHEYVYAVERSSWRDHADPRAVILWDAAIAEERERRTAWLEAFDLPRGEP